MDESTKNAISKDISRAEASFLAIATMMEKKDAGMGVKFLSGLSEHLVDRFNKEHKDVYARVKKMHTKPTNTQEW